jgi:outer membrane protein
LFTTQRDLAKARYDVLVNSLKLRQAAGVLTAGDVDGVNALLTGPTAK